MDEQTALYTAARRYCLERAPGLDPRQQERWYRDRRWRLDLELRQVWDMARGTDEQLEVLGEILFRIEQVSADEFSDSESLRSFLIETGRTVPYEQHSASMPAEEDEQERRLFCRYIEHLSDDDLASVTPLPYRRVLGQREQEKIWQRLKRHWDITPRLHWYPLNKEVLRPHVIALQEDWFARHVPPDVLRQILRQRRIRRVWEMREAGIFPFPQYEMDLDFLIPWGGGGEHCWTSEKMDWLLYTSHEHSVTLGGEWFLNLVKQAWPQWEEHLYAGYLYQRPPLEPLDKSTQENK